MDRPLHEPNIIRAKGRRVAAWCNKAVHDAPWIDGDETTGWSAKASRSRWRSRPIGLTDCPTRRGFPKMHVYDPRRFAWIHDRHCEPKNCVKLPDERTGLTVIWRWL